MKRARLAIGTAGIALIAVGGVFFALDLTLAQFAGVVLWLAAAVVIHDAVLVPLGTLLDIALRRTARRLPPAVVTLAEGGFAVGVLLTAMVVPELVAQARGARNPTVLPGDYGLRLALVWVTIVVLIAAAIALGAAVSGWRARRSAHRR